MGGGEDPTLDTAPERSIPDGSVHTFNVSPDSIYGVKCEYGFETIGILTFAEKFEDWRLEVVPVTVSVD
ncbi:MAG: hypothetical protein KDN22_10275 [Verrucomicrobiae bacterium]|nr:hypothetical protein [Verrucomicrobiae bacterium]